MLAKCTPLCPARSAHVVLSSVSPELRFPVPLGPDGVMLPRAPPEENA